MATLHDATPDRQARASTVKGAVEVILDRCDARAGRAGGTRAPLDRRGPDAAADEAMAGRGLRVLAFAPRRTLGPAARSDHADACRRA